MATDLSNPFAIVLDFSPDFAEQSRPEPDLRPEVAWILYDKTNQQIVKRGHHPINLDPINPSSQIFSSEFLLTDINKLLQSYYYPEVIVENHDALMSLNKKLLHPNLQLDKASHFSVLTDYQLKTDLPFSTLEDVLLSLGKSENNQRLTNLPTRANKILEYYLDSIARKEREQPYSKVPKEIIAKGFGFWKIIRHYFLGLTVTSSLVLGLYLIFNNQILEAIIYFLMTVVTSLFIFQHLRR